MAFDLDAPAVCNHLIEIFFPIVARDFAIRSLEQPQENCTGIVSVTSNGMSPRISAKSVSGVSLFPEAR